MFFGNYSSRYQIRGKMDFRCGDCPRMLAMLGQTVRRYSNQAA